MVSNTQITPGMVISLKGELYRVDSSIKVTAKGPAFIKTKLRNLISDDVLEKNFKPNQVVDEVFLQERDLQYMYLENKDYLFLDIGSLDSILIAPNVIGKKMHFLKEGVQVKATFYGETVFSVELPQFLEIMVSKTEESKEKITVSNATKVATLETGAKIQVPLFVEVGDIVKVDTTTGEYIQRI
ncbi:MAG: Elongation factor P [Chlamydiae bacterium]|nr:Elongation factor P [Chlamydiota bacterium]